MALKWHISLVLSLDIAALQGDVLVCCCGLVSDGRSGPAAVVDFFLQMYAKRIRDRQPCLNQVLLRPCLSLISIDRGANVWL